MSSAPSFMRHVKSHPALEPLRATIETLERGGIPCALGGSGLLAALGLADAVRDWDLMVDAPAREVYPRLDPARVRYVGSDALHADEKLELPADQIEIICRFAFYVKGGIVTLPASVSERRDGIPLASPEVWCAAYWLLGRNAKAESLLAHLGTAGAHSDRIRDLLGQPIPEDLAARLRRLPLRDASRIT